MEPDECDVVIVEQSVIATVDTTTLTSVLEVTLAETEISTVKWRGKPLSEMYSLFNPECKQLLNIEPGRTHTVLFKVCQKKTVDVICNKKIIALLLLLGFNTISTWCYS